MSTLTLVERIQQLDRALVDLPHAFGGALALAYYAEPRATVDIDVNIFVTTDRFAEVAERLTPLGIPADDDDVRLLVDRDGQARVLWDDVPVDMFFSYDPFHDAAAAARRTVPFASGSIPVLAAEHLIVCKVVFNRPKDWVDIDAILAAETSVDVAEILKWVTRLVGDDDARYSRVVAVLVRR